MLPHKSEKLKIKRDLSDISGKTDLKPQENQEELLKSLVLPKYENLMNYNLANSLKMNEKVKTIEISGEKFFLYKLKQTDKASSKSEP